MISKEQAAHDLAVTLAGQYVKGELDRGEYKGTDVYRSMSADAASVYTRFMALLMDNKEL